MVVVNELIHTFYGSKQRIKLGKTEVDLKISKQGITL